MLPPGGPQVDCDTLNNDAQTPKPTEYGYAQHLTGNHGFTPSYVQECIYTDWKPILNGYGEWVGEECAAQLNENGASVGLEQGKVGLLTWHSPYGSGLQNGGQLRYYPENAYATAYTSGAYETCSLPGCPIVTVTWNGSGFSYHPNALWSPTDQQNGECPAEVTSWPE